VVVEILRLRKPIRKANRLAALRTTAGSGVVVCRALRRGRGGAGMSKIWRLGICCGSREKGEKSAGAVKRAESRRWSCAVGGRVRWDGRAGIGDRETWQTAFFVNIGKLWRGLRLAPAEAAVATRTQEMLGFLLGRHLLLFRCGR
jgi:hypothetical protein